MGFTLRFINNTICLKFISLLFVYVSFCFIFVMYNKTKVIKMSTITTLSIKTETKNLKQIYNKRVSFLESKWNSLMLEQSEMTTEEICTKEFQAKRKRIGGLYNRVNKIITTPRDNAVKKVLYNINPNLTNMPIGITQIK